MIMRFSSIILIAITSIITACDLCATSITGYEAMDCLEVGGPIAGDPDTSDSSGTDDSSGECSDELPAACGEELCPGISTCIGVGGGTVCGDLCSSDADCTPVCGMDRVCRSFGECVIPCADSSDCAPKMFCDTKSLICAWPN